MILVTIVIVAFSFACVGVIDHGNNMNKMGSSMTTTLSTGSLQQCCNANTLNHFDLWKNSILPFSYNIKNLLTLFAFSLIISSVYLLFLYNFELTFLSSWKFYIKNHPDLTTFDYLKLAFTRGILNPKLY